MVVNPDKMDIASNFKQWVRGIYTLKNHVTLGAFGVLGIGVYETFYPSPVIHALGITLILVGTGIAADQAAHLFTN